jgi:hypothetical protein
MLGLFIHSRRGKEFRKDGQAEAHGPDPPHSLLNCIQQPIPAISLEPARTPLQDIQLSQNFLQRILDVGDLMLVSKKGDAQRIIVMAVPAPKEVARKICDLQPQGSA